MPVFKHLRQSLFEVVIWHITENTDHLKQGIELHPEEKERFQSFKNEVRKREFLALRHCLAEIFGKNPKVFYSAEGKPQLESVGHISFSHTRQYAAVIFSKQLPVGIDLECFREGIEKIQSKFIRTEENKTLHPEAKIKHLTAYWGGKEAIVKIEGNRQLDFKKEIRIQPFLYQQAQSTQAVLLRAGKRTHFTLRFKTFPKFILTYGWRNP